MIAAVMQPYFFPYIGYFQLMREVDVFVIYDDAQYMKGGWINRNLICNRNSISWITMPVTKAPLESSIKNRRYKLEDGDAPRRIERQISSSYIDSVHWAEISRVVLPLLFYGDDNVATFNTNLLTKLAQALDIGCRFVSASDIDLPFELKSQERVIALCKTIGATRYINPIGGKALYDAARFADASIELAFLKTTADPAVAASGQHLSIIHELAQQGLAGCKANLDRYELVLL